MPYRDQFAPNPFLHPTSHSTFPPFIPYFPFTSKPHSTKEKTKNGEGEGTLIYYFSSFARKIR